MNQEVRTWLATYFQTTSTYVEETLKDEQATSYLLIWPIFEQKLFGGFMLKKNISAAAQTYAQYYHELNADASAAHFHNRYQDTTKYRNLKHTDTYAPVDTILGKIFSDLSEIEKVELMIYVVYRYRNNIFHGNKGIASWSKYTSEIKLCMDFMMSLLDCAERHKGEIT